MRRFDISCIETLIEYLVHALMRNGAGLDAWKERIVLQEAHDFGLRAEVPGGEAFKRLLDNGGEGFISFKNLSLSGHAFVFEPDRRARQNTIAVLDARLHAVRGLLGIFLTLVLRYAGEQVFNKHGIGVLAEFDGRRFQNAARTRDCLAQFQMGLQRAGKARNVIDEKADLPATVLAQEGEGRLHARAIRPPAGNVVGENLNDVVAFHSRELPAARLLRLKPRACGRLLDARHAAVNDRLLFLAFDHGEASFPWASVCVSFNGG